MGRQLRRATEAEAKALASSTRLRIIRACLDRALTNKEIAHRLELNPATALHHVRTLVATGFLEPQEERRGPRGSREVPYLSTGKSWDLDIGSGQQAVLEAFQEEMAIAEQPARLARLGLRLTEEEWEELHDRFVDLLDEYAARDRSGPGRPYSVFLALYEDRSRD
ncbi:winged helix-turn-helix domain-containing protein [Dactylosporangium sp. AC04546]|uniref:ArsR/SmtB family transcription factor n=1 Tax=Dactylosporangium sp. AC04546 TaxID=2862460 RepID=UPI001EDD6560|nr:winged helix-turn-helix domain-containing protein [Dactylosporangium sp. AC04546]WVK84397.1 winged helix-turn-helix domain-containing protein [Dactylosporangium sp. AC04546]